MVFGELPGWGTHRGAGKGACLQLHCPLTLLPQALLCTSLSLSVPQMYKMDLEKAEEPEIKLPTPAGSSKKQESSRKTSTSVLLTTLKPLTVWITTNWKILKEMGIPDHLTCFRRNLYASQEATVGTGHGTTDWFKIGKGVHQGCILSTCLFNLYAEYIM